MRHDAVFSIKLVFKPQSVGHGIIVQDWRHLGVKRHALVSGIFAVGFNFRRWVGNCQTGEKSRF